MLEIPGYPVKTIMWTCMLCYSVSEWMQRMHQHHGMYDLQKWICQEARQQCMSPWVTSWCSVLPPYTCWQWQLDLEL